MLPITIKASTPFTYKRVAACIIVRGKIPFDPDIIIIGAWQMLSMDGLDRSNEILTRESDLCYNKVSFTGGNRFDRP